MSGCSSGVEHNLAKVGVEGSNPFARSSFSQPTKTAESRGFCGYLVYGDTGRRDATGAVHKARGYRVVTRSGATRELKSWRPGNALECNGY